MRKGSYELVKKKLFVELLPFNFRFRSKISCSFNLLEPTGYVMPQQV
jgi:hypothetical protein